MMDLFKFIYRTSGNTIVAAALFAVISGVANTLLIETINKRLFAEQAPLVAVFLGFCILMLATRIVSQWLLVRLSQDAISNLQMRISERVVAAPLKKVESLGSAKIMASVTGDINIVSGMLLLVPMFATQLAVVFGCLIYLAYLSWELFLLLVFLIAVGLLLHLVITKKARRCMAVAREEQDTLVRQVDDLTRGVKELKLNHRRAEQFINEQMYATVSRIKNHRILGRYLYIVAQSWGQVLIFVVLGILVFVWPKLFGQHQTDLVSQYIIVMLFAMAPLSNLLARIPNVTQANISLRKINTIIEALAEDDYVRLEAPWGDHQDSEAPSTWQRLELKDVVYAYAGAGTAASPHRRFELGPITLSFSPGELVFIVGKNGSGKSTLSKLIVGLYTPTSGQIVFDDIPITRENKHRYIQNFSTVFSDYHLFESLLGIDLSERVEKDVKKFISDFGLDRDVSIDDGGVYSTLSLSQGQKRRLAMLNAYLENRCIYLFDEWAADQDPEFRELFYKKFLVELKNAGKTVIVVSHDDAYYDQADRVIRIDEGRICEDS